MKKSIAVLLALALVLSMCSTVTLAYESNAEAAHSHGDELEWTEWTDAGTLPNKGSYYLTVDVALTSAVTIKTGTLNLCLNGHTVSRASGRPFAVSGGTLNIYDCTGSGGITSAATNVARGGLIDITSGGIVRLYGGTLTGGKAVKDSSGKNGYGGAVAVTGSSTFEMYGGTITNCSAEVYGGAVYLSSGTAKFSGGVISGNTAGTYGGGVYAGLNPTVSGGIKITGNKVGEAENNVYLLSGKTLIAGDFLSGAQIGVTAALGGGATIASASGDLSQYFTSDNSAWIVSYEETNQTLVLAERPVISNHKHPVCGDAACTEHGEELVWTEWTDAAALPTEGNICLKVDVELSSAVTVAAGKTLNLCLNGHTVSRASGRPFAVSGGTLNICDCQGTGRITSTATNVARGGLIDIASGGIVRLYGGTLTGGKAVKDSSGKYGYGGAVAAVGDSTFEMYGGKITNCSAEVSGGAVYLAKGKVKLLGGEINDCAANNNGGAAAALGGGAFEICGAKITNCSAKMYGGAVYLSSGTFTIMHISVDKVYSSVVRIRSINRNV